MPGFQETKLRDLNDTVYKAKKVAFDRQEALQKATPEMRGVLENLFRNIDEIELVINYYELKIKKRTKPPRDSLLSRFTEEEQNELFWRADALSSRKYLQLRHLLVELRTEQYSYKDMITTSIMPVMEQNFDDDYVTRIFRIDEDIVVRPFGLKNDNIALQKKIFSWPLDPFSFTKEDLEQITKLVWQPKTGKFILDFEDPKHILAVYENLESLQEAGEEDQEQLYTAAHGLAETLKFYEDMTNLSSLQKEILNMKLSGDTNAKIRDYINNKYGTTYNENYISTIYRQKILNAIAKTVGFHRRAIENIFYPENFKVCVDCGKLLPRNNDFFIRQKKSIDGLAPRCKSCQKKKREAAAIRDGRKKAY